MTAVCLVQAYTIVFVLRIGPVIGTIDARAGRGVHEGDLLAVPLALASVVLAAHGRSRLADPRRTAVGGLSPGLVAHR